MGDKTGIQWTDATWNPFTGCTAVSPGCDNCYAASLASGRLSQVPAYAGLASGGSFNGKVRLLPDRLDQPRRWRKPRRIFVNSMSDLFHEGVPDDYLVRVFAVMAVTPWHIYQNLTKRHGRMRSLVTQAAFRERVAKAAAQLVEDGDSMHDYVAYHVWPLPNVWLGVSAENQQWADIRTYALLDTPAAVRFLSCEPLLGPIDLHMDERNPVDWVIVGGESGAKARPMHPDWARSLRDQCTAAGVPFFFKQFGEWAPAPWRVEREPGESVEAYKARAEAVCGTHSLPAWAADYDMAPRLVDHKPWSLERTTIPAGQASLRRYGKKAAGRELDGREWSEFPERTAA